MPLEDIDSRVRHAYFCANICAKIRAVHSKVGDKVGNAPLFYSVREGGANKVRGKGCGKMKKMAFVALAMLLPLLAAAATETVDGIRWKYAVTDGKASVGGGSPMVGALTIPSSLGGYLVTIIASIQDEEYSECNFVEPVVIPFGATELIALMHDMSIIEQVRGQRKGKYRFAL